MRSRPSNQNFSHSPIEIQFTTRAATLLFEGRPSNWTGVPISTGRRKRAAQPWGLTRTTRHESAKGRVGSRLVSLTGISQGIRVPDRVTFSRSGEFPNFIVLSWVFEFVSPRSNFILIGSVAALSFPLFTISVFVTKSERMYPTCTLSRQSFVLRRLVGLRSGRRKSGGQIGRIGCALYFRPPCSLPSPEEIWLGDFSNPEVVEAGDRVIDHELTPPGPISFPDRSPLSIHNLACR